MRLVFLAAIAIGLFVGAAACGGDDDAADLGEPVAYGEVQAVFEQYACTGCHPGVNSSLDLREGRSYDDLVGIRALEDPELVRVVAGDPGSSFLYLKLGGDAPVGDIPAIGTRMPPRAPPIDDSDLDLVRRWISQGAKNEEGETGGPRVPTPGTPPSDLDVEAATERRGTGTISGSVIGEDRRPLEGALVTLLLKGADLEGGEEHYRVAITNAAGRFTLPDAPAGSYLLKAYAPNTIYVSRIVALDEGETQAISFGLPDRQVPNPSIGAPRVDGRRLSMQVTGTNLDGNYTLAVNPRAGLVFELHNADNAPGRWRATIDRALDGPWIFMAVDENCNVSDFLTVPS
ncbi:MAG TPA: carboxypeptidase regulatory-like domain-containing protein [Gaiellaceae bacterium]